MKYAEFLESKRIKFNYKGIERRQVSPQLYPFQRDIVTWALHKGRAAIFSDCGTGKTPMQLEWARHVVEHTGGKVLILAPLAVSSQTVREGLKFGITINPCRKPEDLRPGINITNYEMLHNFSPDDFSGLVLDESSILKSYSGKYRQDITRFAESIEYRLACTATPAPNDLIEIINHAEYLGVMAGKEIIALFFTQDGNTTHAWRLKGHARKDFYKWLASWCVALRRPSDLGYDDDGFILPELRQHEITICTGPPSDRLFAVEAVGLQEQLQARRESVKERVQACADLVNCRPGPWVVWCNLNTESEDLRKAIDGAVEIKGSDSPEIKEQRLIDFTEGKIRVLVTKPTIAGHGLNWQHCSQMAYVGLSNSYEQLYQATRRCWRYGQKNPVDVYMVIAETEGSVLQNIRRKEREAEKLMQNIVDNMRGQQLDATTRQEMKYEEEVATGKGWTMHLGDSYNALDKVQDEVAGLILFSPPFPGMYAYTNSVHDLGNTTHIDQMIDHFRYFARKDKLMRVLMPGRLCCVHLMQLTAMKSRDGYIGIKDYRGRTIQMMEEEGWIYAGEVTIDKNPQIQATRNKERGLLFKTLATDSSKLRMALADYLLYFRKPGENPKPIQAGISQKYNNNGGWVTEAEWIEWAAPVWYRQTKDIPGGIRETDVLNVCQARETDDERHLCPLQLGVIERAIKLWTAPGETVLDPFAGIGSTGYKALQLEREFIGIELKRSYFESAKASLKRARPDNAQQTIF